MKYTEEKKISNRNPIKNWGELRSPGRLSSSCFWRFYTNIDYWNMNTFYPLLVGHTPNITNLITARYIWFVKNVNGYLFLCGVIMIIFIFVSYKPMRFVLFSEMNIATKPYRKQLYFAARSTKRGLTKHAKVSLIVLNKLFNYTLLTLRLVYMKIYVTIQNGLIVWNSTTVRRNSNIYIFIERDMHEKGQAFYTISCVVNWMAVL